MGKFLVTYDHPKLNQEDTNYLNRSITCHEIEAAIKSLSKKISRGPDRFYIEFWQTFKEELIKTLLKFFQDRQGKNTAQLILLVSHSSQNQTKTTIFVFDEHRYKIPQNNGKPNSVTYQRDHIPWPSQLHPRDAGMVQHKQFIKCNTVH
jgi:hypothetical protein